VHSAQSCCDLFCHSLQHGGLHEEVIFTVSEYTMKKRRTSPSAINEQISFASVPNWPVDETIKLLKEHRL
jgi:hypothetical protein